MLRSVEVPMRGPKPPVIVLTENERQALEQWVRRPGTAQQVALRARLILAAADGASTSPMAREEGIDIATVRLWRSRWLGLQAVTLEDLSVEDRLMDAPRSGRPVHISDEQVCQIIDLGAPRGTAVKKGALQPHRWRYWLTPSGDADFEHTVQDICTVYREAPRLADGRASPGAQAPEPA